MKWVVIWWCCLGGISGAMVNVSGAVGQIFEFSLNFFVASSKGDIYFGLNEPNQKIAFIEENRLFFETDRRDLTYKQHKILIKTPLNKNHRGFYRFKNNLQIDQTFYLSVYGKYENFICYKP
nr:ORF109A [Acipenserid herpesvirus 1]